MDGFTAQAQAILLRHSWPGNVRELMNTMRAVVALNTQGVVELEMLPRMIQQGKQNSPVADRAHAAPSSTMSLTPPSTPTEPLSQESIVPLVELEKREIQRAMALFGHNVGLAAHALGIHPSTLHRKLKLLS